MSTKEILSKLKPVTLSLDEKLISKDLKDAIPHLKKAMDALNRIYLKQQDEKLPELYDKTMQGTDETLKDFFRAFNGPWNTLENYVSILPETENRRPGCSFYPEDFDKKDFEKFTSTLSKADQDRFLDHYTVVRKKAPGAYEAIPYHKYYEKDLKVLASHLEKASEIIKHPELKEFLKERAATLLTGDYRTSDSTWVKLKKTPLELIMGPFEVYDDAALGIKASYESMLMVVDQEKGAALSTIEQNIKHLADYIPLPHGSKAAVGGLAPITVVHEIYGTGEAAAGINASAFNLPNDPWVRKNVGWKQVMIYNIMQAKFENCTRRIAQKLVEGGDETRFESYFFTVLLHEVSHGLGPAYRQNGEPVSKCMGPQYTPVEEAKADIGALYILLKCGDQYGIPRFAPEVLLKSFLAGLFRSIRFGLHEAHGAANIVQFNWFMEHGTIEVKSDGRFVAKPHGLEKTTYELLEKLATLEASATPEEAKAFLERYAKPTPVIEKAIASLSDIPVDIRVTWPDL